MAACRDRERWRDCNPETVNLPHCVYVDTIAVIPEPVRSPRLKIASPLFAAVAAAVFALTAVAQDHEAQKPSANAEHHHHDAPAPTNLKVLPKGTTGEQVHEIMHGWEAQLGAECTTCHTVDPNRKMPNGRPALNFADDSKPEKNTARLMYRMMEDINKNYVSMVPKEHENAEKADAMVTCGTCHRGHLHPEAYVPPKHEDHDHPAPKGQ